MNKHQNSFLSYFIVLPLSLGIVVIGSSRGFAQYNAALLSVSITNGTPVTPRSMFTQTWTFTNNGTVTWAAGIDGCTLDMVGEDSLGAIPPFTNTDGGTYHFPRSAINSGKNIEAKSLGSYSMEFIAPETSGSYTDSFQLNGTNFFGPIVTVQVTVSGGNTNVFDRARTISYANNYAAYVCSDGYFWTNSDYPDFGFYGTTSFVAVPTISTANDCAHFVSCCIGNEPHDRGGGFNIPSRTTPTYGEPAASRIVNTCLIAPGYAEEVSSFSQMEPGDVIGWNWGTNGVADKNVQDLDHVTLYLGNSLTASHAVSALDVGPTYFQTSISTMHLIHILDYPALWTSLSGKKMTFSWTTNWASYALYSASSVNGTWAKVSTTPSKKGITNSITVTMPASGNVFYRLEMP